MTKGKFLVIDGTDGSGKATQTKLLIERMKAEGLPVQTFAFPRYETPTGRKVKQYLMGEFGPPASLDPYQASPFYADDRKAAAPEIEAALAAGDNVVADRYVAANMGHQGSKIAGQEARTAYFRWNDELEFGRNGIPRPDLNVILHVPAETAVSLIDRRGNAKDGHESDLGHLQRAEETYLEISRTFPGFCIIECVEDGILLSPEAIHAKVWEVVRPLLG